MTSEQDISEARLPGEFSKSGIQLNIINSSQSELECNAIDTHKEHAPLISCIPGGSTNAWLFTEHSKLSERHLLAIAGDHGV